MSIDTHEKPTQIDSQAVTAAWTGSAGAEGAWVIRVDRIGAQETDQTGKGEVLATTPAEQASGQGAQTGNVKLARRCRCPV